MRTFIIIFLNTVHWSVIGLICINAVHIKLETSNQRLYKQETSFQTQLLTKDILGCAVWSVLMNLECLSRHGVGR
uniref:Uncharacterized protein n=1 Tax=Anguilla anguilla TaxID=7936 RepID=A0A0E9X196_ANGAN